MDFSTRLECDATVVLDRTMWWDATAYGAHAETAVEAPALTWYIAEGATHSGFNLFYLLQNPNATEAAVRIRYLRPSVWTSLARFAKWMIILCRTSNEDKYLGLTYFITPIASTEGVTVRPLIKMTGQTGFNEVLFENVVIPDTFRLDAVGKGWTVAMTTLLHERGAAESAGGGGGVSLDDRIEGLIALA